MKLLSLSVLEEEAGMWVERSALLNPLQIEYVLPIESWTEEDRPTGAMCGIVIGEMTFFTSCTQSELFSRITGDQVQ